MDWEKNVRRTEPYVAGEQPGQGGVVKLNTNECPYPPSPKVGEVLKGLDFEGLRLYPDMDAKELVNTLADYYHVKPGQIFVGVGSDDVLAMSFLTFFNGGKPILFPDITYSFMMCGRRCSGFPIEPAPWMGISGFKRRITKSPMGEL